MLLKNLCTRVGEIGKLILSKFEVLAKIGNMHLVWCQSFMVLLDKKEKMKEQIDRRTNSLTHGVTM